MKFPSYCTLSCQLASGERKKHCGRRIPPPSLFDQVTPGTLKARQKSKAQKARFLVKQQMYFARPLSAHIKSAAGTWQDSPAWLISENVALLKVRMSSEQNFIDLENNVTLKLITASVDLD